jgi:hypothetical protein
MLALLLTVRVMTVEAAAVTAGALNAPVQLRLEHVRFMNVALLPVILLVNIVCVVMVGTARSPVKERLDVTARLPIVARAALRLLAVEFVDVTDGTENGPVHITLDAVRVSNVPLLANTLGAVKAPVHFMFEHSKLFRIAVPDANRLLVVRTCVMSSGAAKESVKARLEQVRFAKVALLAVTAGA